MARLGRRPVRPGRVTTAVALGTVGLFVISMAAGMTSWPFGAAGAAMLIIAIALLTTASMRGGDKAFVAGTVHVVKVSEPPLSADFGRCEMQVLIDAPGHPGQTVMIRDPRVPVSKWPDVGETLPALVSVSDARRIKIQWDRVGTYGERYESIYDDDQYLPVDVTSETSEFPAVVDSPTAEKPVLIDPFDDDRDPPPSSTKVRRPSPTPVRAEARESIAVLEGEFVEVPSQRTALFEENFEENVEALEFVSVPEPPVFVEESGSPVLITKPNARPDAKDSSRRTAHAADQPRDQSKAASAGSIHGVGITVLVTELERSVQFYRDMLGFYEIDGGPDTAILASGDTRVVLLSASEQAPVNRRLVHLNLEVGDVDAVYEELKLRGVRFTYPPRVVNRGERLELVAAAFKDPDGHGIAITQWKARVS